jgi:RNA polymerase sigma-70 factor (ECF subfamily)
MEPVVPQTEFGARAEHGVAGADARLQELLQRYGAFLRRTIAHVCPPELGLSCDDIEQEARIALWRVLKSEREIKFPGSYIYKVAVSATIRAIRRAKGRREDPLPEEGQATDVAPRSLSPSPDASPHELAARQELRRQINVVLAQLPENRRRAVALHLQGLTTAEIGTLLAWSEPKARNLVHRGLKDLRQSLRALGIEGTR